MGVQSFLFAASAEALRAIPPGRWPDTVFDTPETGLLDTHLAVLDALLLHRTFEEALDALSELEQMDGLLFQCSDRFVQALGQLPDERLPALSLSGLADDEFADWTPEEALDMLQGLRQRAGAALGDGRQLYLWLAS